MLGQPRGPQASKTPMGPLPNALRLREVAEVKQNYENKGHCSACWKQWCPLCFPGSLVQEALVHGVACAIPGESTCRFTQVVTLLLFWDPPCYLLHSFSSWWFWICPLDFCGAFLSRTGCAVVSVIQEERHSFPIHVRMNCVLKYIFRCMELALSLFYRN